MNRVSSSNTPKEQLLSFSATPGLSKSVKNRATTAVTRYSKKIENP